MQRGEDAVAGVQAGEYVREGDADLLRTAARHAVALTGDAHQAAHGLHQEIVAGLLAVRSGLAEARDRAVHEPRIERRQRGVIDAEPGRGADLEVLDQHVRVAGQGADRLAPGVAFQVERNRAFAAVRAQVVGGLAAIKAGISVCVRPRISAWMSWVPS
jgi:hypothetical protein